MTATFRDSSGLTTAVFATNITVPVPAGVVDGDLMIAIINLGPVGLGTVPAGWTHVTGSPHFQDEVLDNHFVVMTRVADSEPANYTWSRSAANFIPLGGVIVAFEDAVVDFVNLTGDRTAYGIGTNAGVYTGTDVASELYLTAIGITGELSVGPSSIISPTAGFTEHEDVVFIGNGGHTQVQSGPASGPGAVSIALELSAGGPLSTHGLLTMGLGNATQPEDPFVPGDPPETALEKKETHVEEGIANLIEQFKDKPKIEGILRSYLKQIQELECVFFDLLTETTIDSSVGVHLDNIGSIVGEPRSGRTDDPYRVAIKARIGLNNSEGTMEDVIAIALSVATEESQVQVTEYFPASFIMEIIGDLNPATSVDRVASFIASGRPAGVRGILVFHVAGSFQYDGPAGSGFDEGMYGGAIEA